MTRLQTTLERGSTITANSVDRAALIDRVLSHAAGFGSRAKVLRTIDVGARKFAVLALASRRAGARQH
jgi:hypothetical protein